jgi:glycosyltransferase involved in cell wall biosynthesis
VERSKKILDANHYTAFIGVEPTGLIWAELLGGGAHTPLIYLSLELYVESDPRFRGTYYETLRMHAKAAHHKVRATIIQDRERAEVLARQDDIPLSRFVYVPVAMKGAPVTEKSTFLYDMLNIPEDKKILIYVGLLNEGRLSLETASAAADLPDDWVMVLHGWCSCKNYQDEMMALQGSKLYLSTNLLPFDQLATMIASAHVGVSFYAAAGDNEKLTGAASSKTAQYLQCGLPVIVNDFESIRAIVEEYRHGICVASPSQIPEALARVISDYDGMRQRAFRCYQEKYEITPYIEKVLDILKTPESGHLSLRRNALSDAR